jgi:acyl-coenzyme A thioesterase PaaI-like protein
VKGAHAMDEHRVIKFCPQSKDCFGCKDTPKEGIGTRAYLTEDNYVVGLITTKDSHQGFPGVIHGGIICTYFDEVLWHLYEFIDPEMTAMTSSIITDFLKPVSVDTCIRIVGQIDEINGRRFTAKGRLLLPSEKIAATCSIVYTGLKKNSVGDLSEKETRRERVEHNETDVTIIRF